MTGKRPYLFWMICWKYISPLAIFIIFISNCHQLVVDSPKYSAYVGCAQQLVSYIFTLLYPINCFENKIKCEKRNKF